jgi:glycosyltransferase involved in cell wall biosynthesis
VTDDGRSMQSYDVVIPTVGRPSLAPLLAALGSQPSPRRRAIVIVDDRTEATTPVAVPACMQPAVAFARSHGRGPAAARNAGIAITTAPWVVFLDDDVVPSPTWTVDLEHDLDVAASRVVGVQGRIVVPLPRDRRPTDWERNVAGLEHARWATADMAYRRAPLIAADGFDERFPRA